MSPHTRRLLVILTLVVTLGLVVAGAFNAQAASQSHPAAMAYLSAHSDLSQGSDQKLDRRLADDRITESSGLAFSNRHDQVLYTHNDSSKTARIFAIASDGSTAATLTLEGMKPRDWEAISSHVDAEGKSWLWVGDIGDNSGIRTDGILLHRVPEPARLATSTIAANQFDSYRLVYPDGPRNAEALLTHPDTGSIYIVTKQVFSASAYKAPSVLSAGVSPVQPNVLHRLPVKGLPQMVTDGVFLPDGRAALLTYGSQIVLLSSLEEKSPTQQTIEVSVPQVRMPAKGRNSGLQAAQVESLAASADGRWLYVGTEGANSPVIRVAVPPPPQQSVASQALDSAREVSEQAAQVVTDGARWGSASPLRLTLIATSTVGLIATIIVWRRRNKQ